MPKKKEEAVVVSYKGFDPDMKCRGFQYEIGKSYTEKGEIQPCSKGFHACEMPLNVLNYYKPIDGNTGKPNKFAIVEQSGTIEEEEDKRASSKIHIKTALTLPQLFKLEFELIKDKMQKSEDTQTTTGYGAHSATTGRWAHSATTGDNAHSATTGDESISSALGIRSKAKAVKGWIIIVDWRQDDNWQWHIENIYHAKVGQKIKNIKIKPDTFTGLKMAN